MSLRKIWTVGIPPWGVIENQRELVGKDVSRQSFTSEGNEHLSHLPALQCTQMLIRHLKCNKFQTIICLPATSVTLFHKNASSLLQLLKSKSLN